MAFPAEKILYTLDEYFLLTDHESDIRYEYHYGKIVAMAGALLRHNIIAGNIFAEFHHKLKGRKCMPFNSDSRLRVNPQMWVYPDVMISCHEEDINARMYVQHPALIVEVLSVSTRMVDYRLKKQHYFQIPDLQYYIMIETAAVFVDVYEKQGDNWVNRIYTEMENIIPLPFLDMELLVAELYDRVVFDEENES